MELAYFDQFTFLFTMQILWELVINYFTISLFFISEIFILEYFKKISFYFKNNFKEINFI